MDPHSALMKPLLQNSLVAFVSLLLVGVVLESGLRVLAYDLNITDR